MKSKAFLTTFPDFVEIQRSSFCWFLIKGLKDELEDLSTIFDITESFELSTFGHQYKIKKPIYSIEKAKQYDGTYSIQLYVPMNLFVFPGDDRTKKKYGLIGEFPLMTHYGMFIINGCERVVVNQILRSPGVYYKKEATRDGNFIYSAVVVPDRGSWLKFDLTPQKEITIYVAQFEKLNIIEFLLLLNSDLNSILAQLKFSSFFEAINIETDYSSLVSSFAILDDKIFDPKLYNIGFTGRINLNKRFNLNLPLNITTLTNQDIFAILDHLIRFSQGVEESDDIDHLGNRRVRSVGELLQAQIRSGLTRLERVLIERMSIYDPNVLKVTTLVSSKAITSSMREFFGSSQLSQFLDQTNPLAELTHKRRISGFGPGGFSRDHVSFRVRDIHPSHYGRVCPIETPEGQNAGLISSLTSYARVNSFGYIETPFFQVKNKKVLKEKPVVYLVAEEESLHKVASADTKLTKDGVFTEKFIKVRYGQELEVVPSSSVELMAVSPIQIVSPATALIPFLEHNDANRALMGSNMQRQAVPLLFPSKPIIGTGLESQLPIYTSMVVVSSITGKVKFVNNTEIHITTNENHLVIYTLQKYKRSNQGTCINQRAIVWPGESVACGQIIADGCSTEGGELALGQNILLAYMPWEGYNFEDALLINERLVYSDLFTSIHIVKYDLEVRETSIGCEVLTKNIPNTNQKLLEKLDDNGIIKKGVFVKTGDILVGKVTPKEEAEDLPEGRLLRAIFGEKDFGLIDNSLKVANGSYGRVIDIRIFSHENGDELPADTNSLIRIFLAQIRKIQVGDKIAGRHGNKGIISCILPRQDMPFLPNGKPIDLILNPLGVPSRMNVGQLFEGLFGLAGDCLDQRFKILPFDEFYGAEASRILINSSLREASQSKKSPWLFDSGSAGKLKLRDGRTGNYFENPITVCKSYILKLIHLVDDKIHARSTGPYSLVTQQPLGGRSQQGGQRLGEMEVWALEAYGAAYTLQELLTLKSDDMSGRNFVLNAIVRGENLPNPGIPESFKVLVLELQSLGIDIGIYKLQNRNFEYPQGQEVNMVDTQNQLNYKNTPMYTFSEII